MAVQTKICGLKTPETVAAAVDGGAALVGFVFYPKSPRAVTPQQAAVLGRFVPAGIERVGLLSMRTTEPFGIRSRPRS